MKTNFTIQPEALYVLPTKQDLNEGSFCIGRVLKYDSINRQLIVDLGSGISGIIPYNEITIYNENISRELMYLIGNTIYAQVTSIKPDGAIYLSRAKSMIETWNSLNIDDIIENAYIYNICKFGLFVDIGNGIRTLIHISDTSVCFATDLSHHFKIGQTIKLKIIDKDEETLRIYGSRKKAYPSLEEAASSYSPGDALAVKVGIPTNGGYYVEITPGIRGIMDSSFSIEEGTKVSVILKKITPKGFRVVFFKFV